MDDNKKMTEEQRKELKVLKQYNLYLNGDGMTRLVHLWSKDDKERQERQEQKKM